METGFRHSHQHWDCDLVAICTCGCQCRLPGNHVITPSHSPSIIFMLVWCTKTKVSCVLQLLGSNSWVKWYKRRRGHSEFLYHQCTRPGSCIHPCGSNLQQIEDLPLPYHLRYCLRLGLYVLYVDLVCRSRLVSNSSISITTHHLKCLLSVSSLKGGYTRNSVGIRRHTFSTIWQ